MAVSSVQPFKATVTIVRGMEMLQVLKDLLNSKKFVASLIGVGVAVGVRVGVPEARIEEIVAILAPILTYIGAQGFADLGKEKAKVEYKA